MNATFKKRLKGILAKMQDLQSELELLNEDYTEWMDSHDDNWIDTKAGEKASEEQSSLEDAASDAEQLAQTIEEIINPE